MAKTVRTRISSLGRDVSFLRLDDQEIKKLFFDEETCIEIDFEDAYDEEVTSSVQVEDGTAILTFSSRSAQKLEYIEMIETLVGTVVSFQDKILPELLLLGPEAAVAAIDELYRNAVLFNPALRPQESLIYGSKTPLPDELERFQEMLPKVLSPLVVSFGYREYFDDELFPVSEEEISDELERMLQEGSTVTHEVDTPEPFELDLEKVRNLREVLSARVIGQKHALDHIDAAVRRLSIGFRDKSRPAGVFLFVGPTGVGKTLMPKELSRYLFGEKAHVGRVDCATLSQEHDVSKLYGPPPGYVGYPHGGDPDENKANDPSILYREAKDMTDGGVLILDEVEKAHPRIWDTMLTGFDEGYVKTSVGNVVDMRNMIIVMTSNLGTKEIQELADSRTKRPVGFGAAQVSAGACVSIEDIKSKATAAAKKYLRPELLGRINEIVPFSDLTRDNLCMIVDTEWERAQEWLNKVEATITLDNSIKNHLVDMCVGSGQGARFVKKMIERYVVDALVEAYIVSPEPFQDERSSILVLYSGKKDSCDIVDVKVGRKKIPYKVSVSAMEE